MREVDVQIPEFGNYRISDIAWRNFMVGGMGGYCLPVCSTPGPVVFVPLHAQVHTRMSIALVTSAYV